MKSIKQDADHEITLFTIEKRKTMNVVRKIYNNLPPLIPVPDFLKNRRVELILLPLDEEEIQKSQVPKVTDLINEFFGAWMGEPLVRPEQGDYEKREELISES